jgi:hypothetical protein
MSNEDYDQILVDTLKYEYFNQLGIPRKASDKLDKAAKKASRICETYEIDPVVYIAAQIKFMQPPKGLTYLAPNQIASDHAMDNVNKFRSIVNRGNTWAGTYQVQKDNLTRILTRTKRTLEEVLLDKSYDFDPWFRCLVTKNPYPNVIRKFGSDAKQQLENPELKNFLDGLAVTGELVCDFTRIPGFK